MPSVQRTFTVTPFADTISVLPAGEGSEITYRADLDLHGISRLTTPMMKLLFERLADETQQQLTVVLDRRR
jgi:hypothetical protein